MAERGEREAIFERDFERVYAYVAYRVGPDWGAGRDIMQGEFRGEAEEQEFCCRR